jgi:hypothetical protein
MNEWLSLLVSWFAFPAADRRVVLALAQRRHEARGRSGITMIELHEQQVEETRRMNATLERIAVAIEKR